MALEVLSRSPDETRALGRRAGSSLRAGEVVLLDGELGSGKTTFVKGIAEACGIRPDSVRSPTFALMHRYRGRPDVIHVDLYREREGVALEDLDLGDGPGDALVVVEWPRDLAAYLWEDAPRIRFEHVDESTRRILLPDGVAPDEAGGR